ncbi:RDD family protein [Archangium lipolyticum]|uniref:RDD family protein n=1 Tax=Archangium lipolyticum TaxID=2970465 RepID=UPI00214A3B99|nr:RDD family protein [Archangium lipolyticum]
MKCGAPLPPVGDCPTCAAATQPAARAIPSLLDKEIMIDRRRPDRDAPAPAPSAPPGMVARAPVPPGMNPANAQGPRPQAPAPAAPRAPGLPVMPPRPQQAPAAQMAPAPAPRPQPQAAAPAAPRAPAPAQAAAPRPSAPPQATPSFNLPGVAAPAPRPSAPQPVVASEPAPAPAPAPRQASAPGLPVMPPRPQAAAPAQQAVAHAPQRMSAADEEASFSVDLDETIDDGEPVTLPMGAPDNPAPVRAAPAVKAPVISETGVTEVHARPASLWRRLLAFTIDTGAIGGVAALYLMLASSVAGVQAPQTGLSGLDAFVIQVRALQSVLVPGAVLLLVLSLVYCAVSAFLWNGRTLGRRLLGLRLVDTHGLAPAPGRAIVRAMLASLSFGLFLAGFWMALFDRRGQTLHDKLTSTYVVQPS